MKAVVYSEEGKPVLEKRPKPILHKSTDAIVKVTLTTICSSDIHILHGAVPNAKPGIILGHEFTGIVEETGSSVRTVKKGDRVAVNVESFCGECFFCRRGFVNNCEDEEGGWMLGCRIDGGQAEYVRIPHADQGLNRIPDSVSDEQALFTGDLLSTGYWAAEQADISAGNTTVVIGAGPAGMCTLIAARLYEPGTLIAVDTDQFRLDTVKKNGLADVILNPQVCDPVEKIRKLTKGRGADSVIEAAGASNTFEMAWKAARPNATVMIEAMYEDSQTLPLPDMYGKNLIFKTGGVDACHCGDILRLIEQGKLDARFMITHRTDLDHALKAYKIFENRADHVIKYAITV